MSNLLGFPQAQGAISGPPVLSSLVLDLLVNGSQDVVHRLTGSASPENLLEMQILAPTRPTDSDILGVVAPGESHAY